eukprot:634769-Prymnesium_polylepis.1
MAEHDEERVQREAATEQEAAGQHAAGAAIQQAAAVGGEPAAGAPWPYGEMNGERLIDFKRQFGMPALGAGIARKQMAYMYRM